MSGFFERSTIERAREFHGHSCPGLAIGIRAAELAARKLGLPPETDLVAVVETDMCGVDAIQVLTGCTFGKGNLIHRDHGKMAFSFFDRRSGKGFRAVLNPEILEPTAAETRRLMKKTQAGEAGDEDRRRLEALRSRAEERILSAALEDLFGVRPAEADPPRPPRVLESLRCDHCGEMTMESRTRRFTGETLCIPCFRRVEQKV
jgi:formylmethanofuran dehydrogenase subunit E